MTENKTKVSEELSKAGETSLITPLLLKLDKLRIVSTSDIQDEDFLFNINGKPCLPRKDLTVITGQPKTGKTMLISILMACCARDREQGGLVGIERIRQEPLKVMWVDTEQNPQSTQYILRKRVMQLIDGEFPEDRFFVFNVRSVDVGERYDLIAEGVDAYRPEEFHETQSDVRMQHRDCDPPESQCREPRSERLAGHGTDEQGFRGVCLSETQAEECRKTHLLH